MRDIFRSSKNAAGLSLCLCLLLSLVLLFLSVPQKICAASLGSRYPGLAKGLLKSAELAPLGENTLLTSESVTITRTELLEGIKDREPVLRGQLEKNLIFLLEQEAVRRILLNEAEKKGIAVASGNEKHAIHALFEHRTRDLTVSENEALAFYAANKEMMGGAPFEQVASMIRSIPVQVFFDADGREVFRDTGFLDKKRIVDTLSRLGVSGGQSAQRG